ncbi:hypothetical protein PV326_013738, partial [Microctonus aethiopoides]
KQLVSRQNTGHIMENMDIDPHVELDKLLEGMDEEIALPATPRPTPARQPSTLPTINPRYGARRGDWMMADSSVTSGITTTSTVAVSPTEPSVSVPTTTTSSTAAIAPSKIPHSTPVTKSNPRATAGRKLATKAQPKIVAIECVKPPGLVKEKTVEHTTAKTQKRTIRVPESTPAAKALAQPIPRIPAPPPATSLRKLMVIPSVKPTVSRIPVIATTTPASARPNVSTSNITKSVATNTIRIPTHVRAIPVTPVSNVTTPAFVSPPRFTYDSQQPVRYRSSNCRRSCL